MSDETKEQVVEITDNNCYVMKAKVPFKEYEKYVEWKAYCQKLNNDYYWSKMWNDHIFTKTYQEILKLLVDKIDAMNIKLTKLGLEVIELKKDIMLNEVQEDG